MESRWTCLCHSALCFRDVFPRQCASDPIPATRRDVEQQKVRSRRKRGPCFLAIAAAKAEVQDGSISLEKLSIMGTLVVCTASRCKFAVPYTSIRLQDFRATNIESPQVGRVCNRMRSGSLCRLFPTTAAIGAVESTDADAGNLFLREASMTWSRTRARLGLRTAIKMYRQRLMP